MKLYDGKFDKVVLPTNRTVSVVSCNVFTCKCDHMTIRKSGRGDWSLFFCERGCIYFDECILHEGQVWIYPSDVPQKYTVHKKDKTVYRYLHFTGCDIASLLKELGIEHSVVIDTKNADVSETLRNISICICGDNALSVVQAEYHTLYLLSVLAKKSKTTSVNNPMNRVTDDMAHSFSAKYNVAEYAKMLNMSPDRFNHLFKEYVGVSPYEYYIKLRIDNACSLLEKTDFKINTISEMCGYSEPMYFTQAFKKVTGLTPSAYRSVYKYKK